MSVAAQAKAIIHRWAPGQVGVASLAVLLLVLSFVVFRGRVTREWNTAVPNCYSWHWNSSPGSDNFFYYECLKEAIPRQTRLGRERTVLAVLIPLTVALWLAVLWTWYGRPPLGHSSAEHAG